jgi:hypothetical protein
LSSCNASLELAGRAVTNVDLLQLAVGALHAPLEVGHVPGPRRLVVLGQALPNTAMELLQHEEPARVRVAWERIEAGSWSSTDEGGDLRARSCWVKECYLTLREYVRLHMTAQFRGDLWNRSITPEDIADIQQALRLLDRRKTSSLEIRPLPNDPEGAMILVVSPTVRIVFVERSDGTVFLETCTKVLEGDH